MIIDKHLASYSAKAVYGIQIRAGVRAVYNVLLDIPLQHFVLARALLFFRNPRTVFLNPRRVRNPNKPAIESLLDMGFILLEDNPPHEIVFGLVGKFWTFSGCLQKADANSFRKFNEAGYAKAVWNFCFKEQENGDTLLSTETRIFCTDARSTKKFTYYWFFVRPFSGLIRREALRIIKLNAERQQLSLASHILS